ncbi:energy-coupling factor transporter transmembrane component T family protein [Prochlorococcus marinus]|uniref:Possible cobalt transport protein n=1 Tax=Prochlorococcus marinus (strain MIT 9211) TaxID=93059 RepID=A9BE10_PROM4|nr:energy-coupling factor transporter transmembrane protein EcfT [Prochlorococcus marinus]ABX08320.1 possible cobalt transport protein [Prochlorococcus marinus str. MIT 9211]
MDFLKKLPIGQFVVGEAGWVRKIDPRLKFAWVMMFLVTPVLAGPLWRIYLVLMLLGITVFSSIPARIWWRSLLFLFIFSITFGLFATFLPTSEPAISLPVRPHEELPGAVVSLPSWHLFSVGPIYLGKLKLGPLLVDRRSLDLGIKTSTLIFTVIHSVNLMLLTTAPEDLMWSLSWFLKPFQIFGLPINRLSFQLLLALRFLPLVQEELQNLLRALATRAINFRHLGFKASLGVFLSLGERFLANILLRAEQGADALLVRTGGLIVMPRQFRPERILKTQSVLINSSSALCLICALLLRFRYGEF